MRFLTQWYQFLCFCKSVFGRGLYLPKLRNLRKKVVRPCRVATDSTIAPPQKTAIFFNEGLLAARHEEGCYGKKKLRIFSCLRKRTIERWRRGGIGHRSSGDTAGSWFQNRRFRSRRVGGGYRRTTLVLLLITTYCKCFDEIFDLTAGVYL